MALTTITPEWQAVSNSITLYIIRRKKTDEAALIAASLDMPRLYNDWANSSGIAVTSAELAVWCIEYIKSLIKMPLDLLVKAAKIDNLI